MDKQIADQSKAEIEQGVEALKRGDKDTASNHFWNALDCLGDIQDEQVRRDELGPLALYFADLGLLDMALIGAREAIVLDKKLGDTRNLAEDILTLGNINLNLGKLAQATENYQEALQLCLDNGDFDNAASASTNLASIIANQDRMPEAITLLRNSLVYLQKKAHPNTEMITRMMLVQVLGFENVNPEELIDVSEKLLDKFGHDLPQSQVNVLIPHIETAVGQYLQTNPDINPQKWKAEHFPSLYR